MHPREAPEEAQSRRKAQPGWGPGEHLQRRVGLFRGLTQRAIDRRLGSIPAIVLSAAIFGLLHWQSADNIGQTLSLVAAIAVYGLMFAAVDRWQHRLGPSIFAHTTINTIAAGATLYQYFSHTGLCP